MRRDQLEHAIRAAGTILHASDVIVMGSQAILARWDHTQLPPEATDSNEVDIMAIVDDPDEVTRLADVLDGAVGELSLFHHTHGFYIDGIDHSTVTAPAQWRQRLIPVTSAHTTGWCLDPYDLCAAKLVASRDKDRDFVLALITAGLIETRLLRTRAQALPAPHDHRVLDWVTAIA